MEQYDVYLYNLPKVAENEVLDAGASEVRTFSSVDDAKEFAAKQRSRWDRVVLIRTVDKDQRLVERYRDGAIDPVPPRKEESTEEGAGRRQ